MKIQRNSYIFLFAFLLGMEAIADYTPGRATRSADTEVCGFSDPSTGNTTGACYVYYERDWDLDLPEEIAELSSKAPLIPFNCGDHDSNMGTADTCYFTLQYADDANGVKQYCDDNPTDKPFEIIKPDVGDTGPDAAMYAMLYGAMMADRPVVVTVNNDCTVSAVRLVETVVRDFK